MLKYVRRGGFDVAAARMLSPSPEEAALLCAHLDGAGANTLQVSHRHVFHNVDA